MHADEPSLRIGPFDVDPVNQCLRRDGVEVTLTPRAWQVLRLLLERRGRLVTKRELLDGVWNDAVVGDAVIKVCVREIRKVLGDDPSSPRYIETHHRRGYRFKSDAVEGIPPRTTDLQPAAAGAISGDDPPPFVAEKPPLCLGREGDLAFLEACARDVRCGRARFVALTGEAGAGKSTMLRGFLVELATREQDARVLLGHGVELRGESEPFLPFLEALANWRARDPGADEALRRFAPSWYEDVAGSAAEPGASSTAALVATRASRMREFSVLVDRLSGTAPIALALEDLHLADASTLDLIQILAARNRASRLLLLATARADGEGAGETAVRTLIERGQFEERRVDPFGPETAVELVARIRPDLDLARVDARLLIEATGGNPLLLSELARELDAERPEEDLSRILDPPEDPSVPARLGGPLERSLTRLPPHDRDLLAAAAVAGMRFASVDAAAAAGVDPVPAEERLLELAQAGRFVVRDGSSTLAGGARCARFRFRHGLWRAALYAGLGPLARARAHEALADEMERRMGNRAVEVACDLAIHRERAGDPLAAARHYRACAVQAARRHATPEAERAIERALSLLAGLGDDPAARSLRLDLALDRGLLRRAAGDMAGAAARFDECKDLARLFGDKGREVRAELLAASAWSWVDLDRARAAVHDARRELPAVEDESLRVHAEGACGYWRLLLDGYRETDRIACERARRAARERGDLQSRLAHTVRGSYFECLRSRYAEAIRLAEEGERLAHLAGDGFEFLLARFFGAWAMLHAGRLGELLARLQDAEELARRAGHDPWMHLFRIQKGWVLEQSADLKGAERSCRVGLRGARSIGHRPGELIGRAVLSYILLQKGDVAGAGREIERALREIDARPVLMDWIWRIHLVHGRSEVRLLQDDLAGAEEDALETIRLAGVPDERVYVALARRRLAEIALRTDRPELARERVEQALAALEGTDIPFAAWRVHETAARAADEAGDPETAAGHRRQARSLLERLAGSLADHPARKRRFERAHGIGTHS